MNTSARIVHDDARSASGSHNPGNPFTALIDAKLDADRRIEQLAARVRDLTTQLARAEEQARRALAQDLHDDTGAALTAASLALARADFWLPTDAPAACADALTQARACLAEVADTCHRIVEGLHEPSFDAGIEKVFGDWITGFRERAGVKVDFNCMVEISAAHISEEHALALFRVMQEALGNVARHARAERASVCLSADAHGMTMSIEDDGVGISAIARRKAGRFGLSGMRARCEALGGGLRIGAGKDGGTSVRARLPWTRAPRRVLRAVNG
jgi:two-component system, NarL family, sensor histidine kinase UhpB